MLMFVFVRGGSLCNKASQMLNALWMHSFLNPALTAGRLPHRARGAFAAQVAGFRHSQTADNMDYKTFILHPSCDHVPYFTLFDEEHNTFLVCARDAVVGGRTRGVFVLDKGGFDQLETEGDYLQVLQQSFPEPFSVVRERVEPCNRCHIARQRDVVQRCT